MDQGKLGPERKLYLREIIARFGHELALNWNIGEENTQSTEEQQKMISYIKGIDPYNHPRVLHSYPNEFWHNKVYTPNLGPQGQLTGAAIQVDWKKVHQYTLRWVNDSATAGQPWVVANDEQGPANIGVPADFSYRNYQGKMGNGKKCYYTPADVRKKVLWGNIMAGGAGVEYYFGYQVPESDLFCEDWRSRHQSWEWANIALTFFRENKIPFWDMENANQLIGNGKNTNEKYAFVQSDKCYLIYLPDGMTSDLDLRNTNGDFTISWFNPRAGGVLQQGTKSLVSGGSFVTIGLPPQDLKEDWLAVVKKK